MARAPFIVGIDLGTTNSAVAYVDTRGRERPAADVKLFEVPQLVAAGETRARPMLPSFLYLPGEHELPEGATRLPWDDAPSLAVGEFARAQGARVPGRLVASAKSWLCHAGVDREAEILPWGAPAESRKLSPVEASAALLKHVRDAWNHQMARDDPSRRLETQEVVLTVPASFDEAARELTVEAARRAGLSNLTLLEEPQAAFYCWIVSHQEGWQREVRGGELILVCDIGGGTTDFSLITVVESPTGPGFRRVAVGDHLMLGGDNIDLALAHKVEAKLGNARLDAEQWNSLRYACREAKERLLGGAPPERWPVTIPGRGSKVIGGSVRSELTRSEVLDVVLEGFFPKVVREGSPGHGARAGLQEFGLPFVSDPAIPRHLAAFLRRHRAEAIQPEGHAPDERPARPDAVLFNGGALTPEIVRTRIVETLTGWFTDDPGAPYAPRTLSNASLDLAVAIGAAYYGVVRRGGGIRIGGGTARSYYVGFDSDQKEAPWLCVVPRDAQEGDEITIESRDFDLLMGQPVLFPLGSSSVRADDRPGDLVNAPKDSILELPPLLSVMRVGRKAKAERVPVRLSARVSEVGTVELWCLSRTDERRWRLQIQLRGPSAPGPARPAVSDEADRLVIEQSEIDAGLAEITTTFGPGPGPEGKGPESLVKRLEEALDVPRDEWPPSALRGFWGPLRDFVDARERGPRYESRWMNLSGYCLRPGTGFPLDEARINALWPVFNLGVRHPRDPQCWADWWVLWRRVAAGLNRARQEEVGKRVAPFLLPAKGGAAPAFKKANRPRPEPHEIAEMWRCAASLERLSPELKTSLGRALAKGLGRPSTHSLWCLGRIGARVPLYGPANTVVPRETAEKWLDALLSRDYSPGREAADAAFALGQIAMCSGDRARDVGPELRALVADRLIDLGAGEEAARAVREFQEREASEQGVALGDSLPVGLRLIGEVEN